MRLSLAVLLVSCIVTTLHAATYPVVWFEYGNVFDQVCAKKTHYKIQSAWVNELRHRLPAIRHAWQTEGTRLLKTTEHITHLSFRKPSYRVVMSLCDFPSMSEPLLVNMRYSLKSFVKTPLLPAVTTSIFYHELLHVYLKGRTPPYRGILKQYAHASWTVREHLFLFAIQKAVYIRLGQQKILSEVIKKDKSLPNKQYARAWHIVNTVGYQKFISALLAYQK